MREEVNNDDKVFASILIFFIFIFLVFILIVKDEDKKVRNNRVFACIVNFLQTSRALSHVSPQFFFIPPKNL